MKRLPPILRWSVLILGGVTGPFLLLIGYLEAVQWHNRHVRELSLKRGTMTVEMPFQTMNSSIRREALGLLNRLPSLLHLGGDGVRIAVIPALLYEHYTLAVWMPSPDAPYALGVRYLIVDDGNEQWIDEYRFQMPVDGYRLLVSGMDARTDGWLGESDICLDGTELAFERVRGNRITSGLAHCGAHAHELQQFVLDTLRQYTPTDGLPPYGN